jgi:hypothetical protein
MYTFPNCLPLSLCNEIPIHDICAYTYIRTSLINIDNGHDNGLFTRYQMLSGYQLLVGKEHIEHHYKNDENRLELERLCSAESGFVAVEDSDDCVWMWTELGLKSNAYAINSAKWLGIDNAKANVMFNTIELDGELRFTLSVTRNVGANVELLALYNDE